MNKLLPSIYNVLSALVKYDRDWEEGAKPDHPDIVKQVSQDSPALITDLEPTQIGVHLLIPESQVLLLYHVLEGLEKGNGREARGSRDCGSSVEMRCKC